MKEIQGIDIPIDTDQDFKKLHRPQEDNYETTKSTLDILKSRNHTHRENMN